MKQGVVCSFIGEIIWNIYQLNKQQKMEYFRQKNSGACAEECIPGATKIGSYWDIPADAEKPDDQRIKSGKFIKEQE